MCIKSTTNISILNADPTYILLDSIDKVEGEKLFFEKCAIGCIVNRKSPISLAFTECKVDSNLKKEILSSLLVQ